MRERSNASAWAWVRAPWVSQVWTCACTLPGFWLGPNRSFAWRYAYRCRAAPSGARSDTESQAGQDRVGACAWLDRSANWEAATLAGAVAARKGDIGNAGRPTRRHTAGLIRRPLLQIVANCLWIDTRALFLAARYERRSAKRRAPPGQAKEGRIDPQRGAIRMQGHGG